MIYYLATILRNLTERIAPNPKTLMYEESSRFWEAQAKEALRTLTETNKMFREQLKKMLFRHRVMVRSYTQFVTQEVGVRAALEMDEDWPERYSIVVSLSPQIGFYLMDGGWDNEDQKAHVKNFSDFVGEAATQVVHHYLTERVTKRQPHGPEEKGPSGRSLS